MRTCEICGESGEDVYSWFIYAPQAWKDGYRTCDPDGESFDAHRQCAARVEEDAWKAYEKALAEMGVRLH